MVHEILGLRAPANRPALGTTPTIAWTSRRINCRGPVDDLMELRRGHVGSRCGRSGGQAKILSARGAGVVARGPTPDAAGECWAGRRARVRMEGPCRGRPIVSGAAGVFRPPAPSGRRNRAKRADGHVVPARRPRIGSGGAVSVARRPTFHARDGAGVVARRPRSQRRDGAGVVARRPRSQRRDDAGVVAGRPTFQRREGGRACAQANVPARRAAAGQGAVLGFEWKAVLEGGPSFPGRQACSGRQRHLVDGQRGGRRVAS
jgi:hypothetical protein